MLGFFRNVFLLLPTIDSFIASLLLFSYVITVIDSSKADRFVI
jgi:hypothetical protein